MFWMILTFVLAQIAPADNLPDHRTWTRNPALVSHWNALHEEEGSFENKPIRKKVTSVVIIDM
jgi:hypothetical protein